MDDASYDLLLVGVRLGRGQRFKNSRWKVIPNLEIKDMWQQVHSATAIGSWKKPEEDNNDIGMKVFDLGHMGLKMFGRKRTRKRTAYATLWHDAAE
jgi:hypothetical protein